MSELKNLIEELQIIQGDQAWHGPGLKTILSGITAEQAARRPNAGGHTIWELVLHIAAWEKVFTERLHGEARNEPEEGDFPAIAGTDEASWKQALRFLQEAHDRLIQTVSGLQESDLQNIVAGKDFTVGYMLHGIVRHNVYHAGQIRLLSKM